MPALPASLPDAISLVAEAVDARFDTLLAIPDDPRADLDECPICFLVQRPPVLRLLLPPPSRFRRRTRREIFVSDAVRLLSSCQF